MDVRLSVILSTTLPPKKFLYRVQKGDVCRQKDIGKPRVISKPVTNQSSTMETDIILSHFYASSEAALVLLAPSGQAGTHALLDHQGNQGGV